jgi:hypothetical protein
VDGEAVLNQAAESYRDTLGQRLLASYALGSLAHGGFSPLVSDIDLGLILADPVAGGDADTIQGIAEAERARGSELHRRLSVFWGTPATLGGRAEGGRFPPLDRLDLLENGRLLYGEDVRQGLPRPDRRELLVTGAEFALDFLAGIPRDRYGAASRQLGSLSSASEDSIEEIRHPGPLVGEGPRRVTKLVLFPVRFLYTAATGEVGTNDAAVAHYLEQPGVPSTALVAAALGWRRRPWADDAEARALLEAGLPALYRHYLDDHIARLDADGRGGLADRFRQWRARLPGAGA